VAESPPPLSPLIQGLIGSTGCRLQRKEGNKEEEDRGRESGGGRVTAGNER